MVGHLNLTRFALRAMWTSLALLLAFGVMSLATLSEQPPQRSVSDTVHQAARTTRNGPDHPRNASWAKATASTAPQPSAPLRPRTAGLDPVNLNAAPAQSPNGVAFKPTVFVESTIPFGPSLDVATQPRAHTQTASRPAISSVSTHVESRLTSMQRQLDNLTERVPASDSGARITGYQPASGSANRQLESRLAGLQQHFDQLAQSQSLQILQQQQLEQLRRLQQELEQARRDAQQESGPASATPRGDVTPPDISSQPPPKTQAPGVQPPPTAAPPSVSPNTNAATNSDPVIRFEKSDTQQDKYRLTIQEADIKQVLEMFAELSGRNIVVGRSVAGTVSASLNGVNIEEALAAILRSQGLVYEQDEKFIFVATPEDAEKTRQLDHKITTRIYRPKYISATDLQILLTPLLSTNGGKIAITTPAMTGLEADNTNGGGDQLTQQDALLVMDYPHVLEEMDKVVDEMDIPPSQVVIEAMILTVNLTDELQFGVNFALLSNRGKGLLVSGDGSQLNSTTGFPPKGDSSGASIVPAAGEFVAQTSGLKFGLIRGDITTFVEALESISDTSLIASPQLRVINKQKAELIIGSRLGYSTTTNNGTTSIQNVSFLDVGTKLILRPFISPDGMVRMEIHPERSSGKINATTNLPDTQTTEVTTNVMVRDGTTVVIGGLIDEQIKEEIQRVPLLGAIPLIGPAFQNKSENVVRTEMIVLITPRIVQPDVAATVGETAKLEFEQRADHFSRDLSPINRNNLTRLHLERAQFYLDRGEFVRAHAHAREAVHLNKTNKAALAMLQHIEQLAPLTRKQWWRFWPSKQHDTLPPPLIRLRNFTLNDEMDPPTQSPVLPSEPPPRSDDVPFLPPQKPLAAPPPPPPSAEALRQSGVPGSATP